MKKRITSAIVAMVLLMCCTVAAWAAGEGQTIIHTPRYDTLGMEISISNVTSQKLVAKTEILEKYVSTEEQIRTVDFWIMGEGEPTLRVYECSSPAKVELKAGTLLMFYAYSGEKQEAAIELTSVTEVDEEDDWIYVLPGESFVLNEPGVYVFRAQEIAVEWEPFIVVVSGAAEDKKLVLSGWKQWDDGHGVDCEIHNNTNKVDTSLYALVLVTEFGDAEVHFLNTSSIKPGAAFYGEIHTQYGADAVLNGRIKAILVSFTDEKDKQNFSDAVPWERLYPSKYSSGNPYDYQVSYDKSVKWLKDTFNITVTR